MPGQDVLVGPPTGGWRARRSAMERASTRDLWTFLVAVVCFTAVLGWWSVEHVVHPGWAVAGNDPLVDAKILLVAAGDVVVLHAWPLAVPAVRVLRARGRWVVPPAVLRGLVVRTGRTGPVGRTVASCVVLPVVVTVVAVGLVVGTWERGRVLASSGVEARATVVSVDWGRWTDGRLTVDVAGYERVTLTSWDGFPRRGGEIDVVVDPGDPSRAAQSGAGVWGLLERSAVVAAGAGAVTTCLLVPAALTGLVQRRRGGG
ncbi:hypothetical protein ATJ88_1926 [Isoptericola jiangsuensis]|uniref:Uncharacterized protein n=2 Tax=Isoptericola jiangsuensis TaxID=548579 RepID=A0A2A9EY52_9MICO|nr:hypothetical protein ATJ88_1926 [Isoptericola jiangsuensis]